MAASLAVDTREAFARAKVAMGQSEIDLVEQARVSTNEASGQRDRLLESVVMPSGLATSRFGRRCCLTS